jgi:prepilin-type N-terminal cleavage/methylation domain-containing protein
MRTHSGTGTRRGFTLIEILIVVVILGIIAAIVIPQFRDATGEASETNLLSQLRIIRGQIAMHNVHNPGTAYDVATPVATFWDSPDGVAAGLVPGDYLQVYPRNPLQANSSVVGDTPGPGTGWVWAESSPGDPWTLNIFAVNETGGWFDADGDGQPD